MDTVPPHTPQDKPDTDTTWIYALIDPTTQEIRYIGKANDPQHRLQVHIRSCEKEATYKSRWIKGLKLLGLEPILKIVEEVPSDIWKEREMYWIQYYHAQGAPLTNGTAGGDGMQSPTPEVRSALSRAHKGKKRPDITVALKGKKRPPEVGAKVSATRKMRPLSDESRAKMSAAKKGKECSPEAREKLRQANLGKDHGPEFRAKMREVTADKKGKKRSPEIGAKVSATKTGTKRPPFSEEWRANIGKAQLGRKRSPESIEKMSIARKKWHAMKKSPPSNGPDLWSDHAG